MTVKTGRQTINLPAYCRATIIAETEFSAFVGEGDDTQLVAVSSDKKMVLRTKEEDMDVHINVPEGVHWSPSLEVTNPFDKSDPKPFEVPEELKKPETLEEKLQRFAAGMVAEMYGRDSAEMETFEEAMDFDIDDEIDMPLSNYEIPEATQDEYIPEGDNSEAETSVTEPTTTVGTVEPPVSEEPTS